MAREGRGEESAGYINLRESEECIKLIKLNMNFLILFVIIAMLAHATEETAKSIRPDDYVDGEDEMDYNSKVSRTT